MRVIEDPLSSSFSLGSGVVSGSCRSTMSSSGVPTDEDTNTNSNASNKGSALIVSTVESGGIHKQKRG